MEPTSIYYLPSGETLAFVGIASQAAALVWLWRDWKMSQYQHGDWRKQHHQSESKTLSDISALWVRFGGPAAAPPIDWDSIGSAELEDISKSFPAEGDDDALKRRKVDYLTPRYGIGPSDVDLIKLRGHLDHLTLLRRGVADYRTFIRQKTFQTALKFLLVGFALQLVGSVPSRWFVAVETSPVTVQRSQ